MIKGRTNGGFDYEISETRLDNMELVDALAEAQENPLKIGTVVTLLLGSEQKKKLYDHLRLEDGTVPSGRVSEEIVEIFNSCKAGKN